MKARVICFCLAAAVSFSGQASAEEDLIHRATRSIPGEYVVKLDDDVVDPASLTRQLLKNFGGVKFREYRRAIKGFAVRMPEAAAQRLARHPLVDAVEENAIGRPSSTYDSVTIKEWHLDRIDGSGLDGKYYYCDDTEVNDTIVVYVFDTGMRRTHDEFKWENPPISGIGCTYFTPPCPAVSTNGYDYVNDDDYTYVDNPENGDPSYTAVNMDEDCLYGFHGHAVASIIAGRGVGVAQAAYVWPVRIGSCDGDIVYSDVIYAIDKVLDERSSGPGVANFSFFFPSTTSSFPSLSSGISAMRSDGIVVVASANNQDQDRCSEQYPAGYSQVITVGGTFGGTTSGTYDDIDSRVTGVKVSGLHGSGSNYGSCIDIFAPGYDMRHALPDSDTAYEDPPREDSAATSYAAAIVSGAFARYFAEYPTASVSTAESAILGSATTSVDLECAKEQSDYNGSNDPLENYSSCQSTTTKLLRVSPECD